MAFPSGWTNKIKISVSPDNIDSTLTDWTLVFDQSFSPNFTQVNGPLDADGNFPMLNGGGDLRASSDADGLTRLPIDVRSAVTDNDPSNGSLEVAVKIPSVSSSEPTDIYLWWGKPGETQPVAGDTYGQYNAYDSNFVYVSHDGGYTNRKSSGSISTKDGIIDEDATGKVGVASDFGGTGHYDLGDDATLNFVNSDFTSTILVYIPSTLADVRTLSGKYDHTTYNRGWLHRVKPNVSDDLAFYYLSEGDVFTLDEVLFSGDLGIQDDDWHLTSCRFERSSKTSIFVDGSEAISKTADVPSSVYDNDAEFDFGNFGGGLGTDYENKIDEIRLSSVYREDSWLKAEYHNLFNTSGFLTVSGVEQIFVPEDYASRMKITLSHSFVDTTLTDWTLVLDQSFDSRLTSENGPLDADGSNPILNGGDDIRVTSDSAGLNRLPIDIRSAVTDNDPSSGKLEIAIKIPSLSGISDTDIYIWWGNADAIQSPVDGVYGQYNAYDSYHELVLPNGASSDRSSHQRSTTDNSITSGDVVGKVGKATHYAGNNSQDRCIIGDTSDWNTILDYDHAFTIEGLWMFSDNTVSVPTVCISKIKATIDYRGISMVYNHPLTKLNFTCQQDNSPLNSMDLTHSSFTMTEDQWYQFVGTNNGTSGASSGMTLYVNGEDTSATGSDNGTMSSCSHNDPLLVGSRNWGTPSSMREWEGDIDEVRISSVERSAAWIKANYNNQFNTTGFITFSDIKHRDVDERYFVGDDSWSWNDDNNWSLFSGEPGGHSVPGVLEEAVFDSNSPSCSSAIDINIKSLDVRDTFLNAIHLNGNDLTQTDTAGVFNIKGGTFNIGSGDVSVNATSVDISVDIPSYSGSMIFNVDVGDNQEIYGGATFNGNVEMRVSQASGAGRTRTIDEPITITGDIYLQECELPKEYTQDGWIYKDGTGTVSGDNDSDFVIMNLKLKFIGVGDVTFYGMEAYHAEVTYDKTSGTVIMEGRHAFVGRSVITYDSATDYLTNLVTAQFRSEGYGDVYIYPNVEPTYYLLFLNYDNAGGLPSTYDFDGGVVNVRDYLIHSPFPAQSIGRLNNGTINILGFSLFWPFGSVGDISGTAIIKLSGGEAQTYRDPTSLDVAMNDIVIEKDAGSKVYINGSMKVGSTKDITVNSGILVVSGTNYLKSDNLTINNPTGELLILSGDADVDVTLLTNNNYVRTDYPASLPSGFVNNKFVTPSVYFGYRTAPFWDDSSKVHDKLTPTAMYRKAFN